MKHETLGKIIQAYNKRKTEMDKDDRVKEEFKKIDIILKDDTATQLISEADNRNVRNGMLVLTFSNIEVEVNFHGKGASIEIESITGVFHVEYCPIRKYGTVCL